MKIPLSPGSLLVLPIDVRVQAQKQWDNISGNYFVSYAQGMYATYQLVGFSIWPTFWIYDKHQIDLQQ